jgi:hypothetical protein
MAPFQLRWSPRILATSFANLVLAVNSSTGRLAELFALGFPMYVTEATDQGAPFSVATKQPGNSSFSRWLH